MKHKTEIDLRSSWKLPNSTIKITHRPWFQPWYILLLIMFTNHVTAQNANPKKSWALPNMDSLYDGTAYAPFRITTTDGKIITNESCLGKVTFISLWFEGCAGCREEFGEMNELYDSLKSDSKCQFLAITYDDLESLKNFITKYKIHYPVATNGDYKSFHQLTYGMGCPAIVVLDKEGRIAMIGMKTLAATKKGPSGDFSISKAISFVRNLE